MKPRQFAPGPGYNRPPLGKDDYLAAIEHWAETRRVAEALAVEELGELDPGPRLVAFARSGLEAMAHWCRQNPRADVSLALLWAIYLLSDNEGGVCDMSQERLARFFGRSRKHINDCIEELRKQRLIRVESVTGKTSRLSPIVSRLFAENMQSVWLFDALAPYEHARAGRKPKDRGEIPVTTSVTPICEIPVTIAVTSSEKRMSPKTEIPVTTAVTQISLDSPVAA